MFNTHISQNPSGVCCSVSNVLHENVPVTPDYDDVCSFTVSNIDSALIQNCTANYSNEFTGNGVYSPVVEFLWGMNGENIDSFDDINVDANSTTLSNGQDKDGSWFNGD